MEPEKIKELLKSLCVNVRGLVSNRTLYGKDANPNTFTYKGDSAWYCEFHPYDETIDVNSTYFAPNMEILEYNKKKREDYLCTFID